MLLVKHYESKIISDALEKETIIFSCINYELDTIYQSLFQFLMSVFYLSSFVLSLPWEEDGGFAEVLLGPIYYGQFAVVVNFVVERQ